MNQTIPETTNQQQWELAVIEAETQFIEIAKAEGNQLVYQKEAVFAMQAIQNNERLQQCAAHTIRDAVINVASIGLSLNPAEKLAYLVPRGGKACLDVSYIGLIKAATDSGSIIWVKADLVYERDPFEATGINQLPIHKYNPFEIERGKIIGGYSVAKLHNGDHIIDFQTEDYFQQCRNVAKTQKIWDKWPEAMRLKTLVKVGSKFWPKSERLDRAIHVSNEYEGADFSPSKEAIAEPQPRLQPPVTQTTPVTALPPQTQNGNNGKKLNANQIKMVSSRLDLGKITKDELYKAFNVKAVEDITLGQINDVLSWIRGHSAN